ncbi:MAG: hypothetical protein N2169_06930 [bacterium]|nr:hypothetical protein [bacterium]
MTYPIFDPRKVPPLSRLNRLRWFLSCYLSKIKFSSLLLLGLFVSLPAYFCCSLLFLPKETYSKPTPTPLPYTAIVQPGNPGISEYVEKMLIEYNPGNCLKRATTEEECLPRYYITKEELNRIEVVILSSGQKIIFAHFPPDIYKIVNLKKGGIIESEKAQLCRLPKGCDPETRSIPYTDPNIPLAVGRDIWCGEPCSLSPYRWSLVTLPKVDFWLGEVYSIMINGAPVEGRFEVTGEAKIQIVFHSCDGRMYDLTEVFP